MSEELIILEQRLLKEKKDFSGENNSFFGKKHSDESKKKMSEAHKGKRPSEETRLKLSARSKGEKNPMFGKLHTPETRMKMSQNHADFSGEKHPNYGKRRSKETCLKISITKKGKPLPEETKIKMSESRMGERNPNFGKHLSEEARERISFANKGENSPNWKGGISFEPYCPKWTRDLKRRIRAFFDHRCILCGKTTEKNGQDLSCHHVEYNKNACCDGKPVQFAALCRSCHSKTGFKRANWEFMIHRIIDEIYNNRSYFTKEEWNTTLGKYK